MDQDWNSFHTFEIQWTPDYVAWYMDGNEVRRAGSSDPGVGYLTKAQNLMMNFWVPTWSPWGDNFDPAGMPWELQYDWVEVYTYDQTSKTFDFQWRDDFTGTSLNTDLWLPSNNWSFDQNNVTFMQSQVSVQDGCLVLTMIPQ